MITSPITFPSTVNAILYQRAKPVFVDVNLETLNIDVSKLRLAITKKTKAIIAVHMAGHPCEMDEIYRVASKYGLYVIEDAAHAIGAEYKEKKVGGLRSIFAAFSFYPIKNMTTGEGGMLTTHNDALAEKVRLLSLHGMSRDAWKRYSSEISDHWEVACLGYKYNMSDLQAAIGLHQLEKLDSFISTRTKYAHIYDEAFSQCQEITLLRACKDVRHAHHLYIILLNPQKLRINRDQFIKALHKENIGFGIHFRSLCRHPYYQRRFSLRSSDFSNSDFATDRILSLPLYPKMSEGDVEDVIRAVKKIINYYRA